MFWSAQDFLGNIHSLVYKSTEAYVFHNLVPLKNSHVFSVPSLPRNKVWNWGDTWAADIWSKAAKLLPSPSSWMILLSPALPFFSRHSVLQSFSWFLSLPRFDVFSGCEAVVLWGAEPVRTLEISWSVNNMNKKSVSILWGRDPCLTHHYTPSSRHSAWLIGGAQIIFFWRQRRRYIICNTSRGGTDF